MVDVSSQSKIISVNVSSSGVSSNVNASGDTTMYYSNKAREWAISNRIVDGVDYSSKYYANKSNQSALNAQSFAQSAQDSYNNFQQSVDGALSNIDSSVQEGVDVINNTKTEIINDIELIANGEKQEINELANVIKDSAEDIVSKVLDEAVLKSSLIEAPIIVETYQNGYSSYEIYSPDAQGRIKCVQRGRATGGSGAVSLLKKYADKYINIQLTSFRSDSSYATTAWVIGEATTSSFQWAGTSNYTAGVYWKTEGYL